MRTANRLAVVDEQKCSGCGICVKICPVEAICLEKKGNKHLAVIDEQGCLDCTLCFTRCPEYAISMVARDTPLTVSVDMADVSEEAVTRICKTAHMYPDQVICYCHRVQAKEVAAAILRGAKTPEDVARASGARTGCATLCIGSVIRLLRAIGIKLIKAPGYQWYGVEASIWNITPELLQKYPQYYLTDDLDAVNAVFPAPSQPFSKSKTTRK